MMVDEQQSNYDMELVDQHEPVTFWEWKVSIFECPENPAPCWMSFVCPCFALGRTMHRLGLRRYSDVAIVSFCIVMLYVIAVPVIASKDKAIAAIVSLLLSFIFGIFIFKNRELVRRRLGIQPSSPSCVDCAISIGCQCCVISQMSYQAGITDFQFYAPFVADLSVMRNKNKFVAFPAIGPGMSMMGTALAACSHPNLPGGGGLNGTGGRSGHSGSMTVYCPDCGARVIAVGGRGGGQAEPTMVTGATRPMGVAAAPAPAAGGGAGAARVGAAGTAGVGTAARGTAAAGGWRGGEAAAGAGTYTGTGTDTDTEEGGAGGTGGRWAAAPTPVASCSHLNLVAATALNGVGGGRKPLFCPDCGKKSPGVFTAASAAAAAGGIHYLGTPRVGTLGPEGGGRRGGGGARSGGRGGSVCYHPNVEEAARLTGGRRPAFCSDCGAAVAPA